jgi:hypothetical protein
MIQDENLMNQPTENGNFRVGIAGNFYFLILSRNEYLFF